MGVVAGIAAAGLATSIGSQIANSGGGGGGAIGYGGADPNIYNPQYQGAADANWESLTNNMYGVANTFPQQNFAAYQNLVSGLQNNPYAAGQQNTANQAGAYLTGTVAPNAQQGAAQLQGLGNAAAPYASQILQTGFDPQNALYNRTQQQLTDQLNATNANSGLASSPYGAGVVGQGLTNFNIDWQNNQLGRQATAASAYGNLTNSIGQDYTGAGQLGTAGAQALQAGGTLPYSTFVGQGNDQQTLLNNLNSASTQSFALPQLLGSDYLSYMGHGTNASQLDLQNQGQGFNQSQAVGQGVGQGISGLSSALGGINWGNIFGSGNPSLDTTLPASAAGYNTDSFNTDVSTFN